MACCNLVGNLQLGLSECIISVSTNCTTEYVLACAEVEPLPGPTIGTINISGFASRDVHIGCPGKASVSIPFIRKYDCVLDELHFIWNGKGQSSISGDIQGLASLDVSLGDGGCPSYSASSSSGPATIYMVNEQTNGYGMSFTGTPISFTTDPLGTVADLGELSGGLPCFLQSFNLDCQPGQIPVASYSFVYSPEAVVEGDTD